MDADRALGQGILRCRKAAGLNQLTVTQRAGLGMGRLSRIEAGKAGVSQQGLADIAAAIGVRVSEIWAAAEASSHALAATAEPGPGPAPAGDPEVRAAIGVLADLLADQMPAARGLLARRLRSVQSAVGGSFLLELAEAVEANADTPAAETSGPVPPR